MVYDGRDPAEEGLVVDVVDSEAVVRVVRQAQACPAAGDEHAAALGAGRLDGCPGDVGGCVQGHAAEADVHRCGAGVQERLQVGGQGAFVGQDPRAGLHDVEVRQVLPRAQDRVHRQPRPVGEDVLADVFHRCKADRRAVGVEGLEVKGVDLLSVQVPQGLVVGHVGRSRRAGPRRRQVVRGGHLERVEARVHVADAQLLGHRADTGRHQTARHQHVTALGRLADRLEVRGDQLGRERRRVRRRRSRPQCAHVPPEGHQLRADTGQQFGELLVRRGTHAHLRAELPQLRRQSRQRRDVAARSVRHQQHTHVVSLVSVGAGIGRRRYGRVRVFRFLPASRLSGRVRVGRC